MTETRDPVKEAAVLERDILALSHQIALLSDSDCPACCGRCTFCKVLAAIQHRVPDLFESHLAPYRERIAEQDLMLKGRGIEVGCARTALKATEHKLAEARRQLEEAKAERREQGKDYAEEVEALRVELAIERAKRTVAPLVAQELEVEKIPSGLLDMPLKAMDQQESFRWLVERSNRLDAAQSQVEALTKRLEAALGELRNIAEADTPSWDKDVRDQFQPWAQNRARHALKSDAAQAQQPEEGK